MGKRILKIEIDKENQHFLKFSTDKGEIIYQAEGDCCSESWFYGFNGVLALLGFVVYTVEKVDMGEIKGYVGRQEETCAYCIKLTSTGGHTDIEFRNSSNGYYGGEVVFLGTNDKYQGEFKKIVWQEIKDDCTF